MTLTFEFTINKVAFIQTALRIKNSNWSKPWKDSQDD